MNAARDVTRVTFSDIRVTWGDIPIFGGRRSRDAAKGRKRATSRFDKLTAGRAAKRGSAIPTTIRPARGARHLRAARPA